MAVEDGVAALLLLLASDSDFTNKHGNNLSKIR